MSKNTYLIRTTWTGKEPNDENKLLLMLTIVLTIFALTIVVWKTNPRVTGFFTEELKERNSCQLDKGTISRHGTISCKYLDHNEKSVVLELGNNPSENFEAVEIVKINLNSCENTYYTKILSGGTEKFRIECDEISYNNHIKISYTNTLSGVTHSVTGRLTLV